MQLLAPVMLLVLGLIPVLILLHFLQPKPKPVEVTNLFLWQEVLRDRGGRVAFKRLINNAPLWLQILLVLLLALALARPVWTSVAQQRGYVILVLDTSASMKTNTGKGTRFEQAQARALELVARLERQQKILIIDAGHQPRVVAGFSDDREQARNLIKQLQASDVSGNLKRAVFLALSFFDPGRNDLIYLVTDGAGEDLNAIVNMHPAITPVLIAGGKRNVGITKFEFRQDFSGASLYEMMVEIKNFTEAPVEVPLRLSIDKITLFNKSFTLNARKKRVLIFPYSGLMTGILRAELEVEDDFPVDDAAFLALSDAQDIWVLLASKGNYFLEKLLGAYPNILVNTVQEIDPDTWEQQTTRHDLVIVDRMDFPAVTQGNFFLIDAYSPSLPLKKTGLTEQPHVVDWERDGLLMSNVNLRGLTIEQAARIQPNPLLHPVIEAEDSGLMYRYEAENLRVVFLGFDLARSDLPLRVAFPMMMSNIMNWLNPHKLSFSTLRAAAGEPYFIHVAPTTTEISIRVPGKRWKKYDVKTNPFPFYDTNTVGVYMISEHKKKRFFTVNLTNDTESDILTPPVQEAARAHDPRIAADEQMSTQQPLWMGFLAAALLLVMLEWGVWLKT